MEEIIIYAPGLNASELTRSLARNDVSTMNMRFFGTNDLLEYASKKSGYIVDKRIINNDEATLRIYDILKGVSYFKGSRFKDCEHIKNAIDILRLYLINDKDIKANLKKGEFKEKNEAILKVYEEYKKAKEKENVIDSIDAIKEIVDSKYSYDLETITLKEYPLKPLEELLLNKLSNNIIEKSIIDYLPSKEGAEIEFVKAYGASNEIEYIIHRIKEDNVALDDVTILAASPKEYSQLLFDISRKYNLDFTYGCGLSATGSLPLELFNQILIWDNEGYHGEDAIHDLVFSNAFNRNKLLEDIFENEEDRKVKILSKIASLSGRLKLSFDQKDNNKKIDAYEKVLKKELKNSDFDNEEDKEKVTLAVEKELNNIRKFNDVLLISPSHILKEYSVLREDKDVANLDKGIKKRILRLLELYPDDLKDKNKSILEEVTKSSAGYMISEPGCLHIASIDNGLEVLRPYTFIVGLAADAFPGSPREDYLLLDCDYPIGEAYPTSYNLIKNKREHFKSLIDIAYKSGIKLILSYPEYNLSALKDRNASSLFIDIYEEYLKDISDKNYEESFKQADYFINDISVSDKVGKCYIDGKKVKAEIYKKDIYELLKVVEVEDDNYEDDTKVDEEGEKNIIQNVKPLDKEYSPSALSDYLNCKRQFLLTRILGMKEDEEIDPLNVIEANELGTLLHSIMEIQGHKNLDKKEFMKLCEESFDDFMIKKVPLVDPSKDKKEFLDIANNAYEMAAKNEVYLTEEKIAAVYDKNIRVGGYPDCIEKEGNGYTVIDYKTGRKLKHKENDAESCMQTLLYAWMFEKLNKDKKVTKCEYRYPRINKVVKCEYNKDTKEYIETMLGSLKEDMKNHSFDKNNKAECTYCSVKELCNAMDRLEDDIEVEDAE